MIEATGIFIYKIGDKIFYTEQTRNLYLREIIDCKMRLAIQNRCAYEDVKFTVKYDNPDKQILEMDRTLELNLGGK